MKRRKTSGSKIAMLCFWLLLWQIAATGIGQPALFAGPVQVGRELVGLLVTTSFWKVLLCSTARVLAGILLAFAAGLGLGILSAFHPLLQEFLKVPVNVLQAIPVACYAVLLLIWYGSGPLTVIITFVIVFPNLYFQTIAGIGDVDTGLWEMARVYRFCSWDKAMYLYRPAMYSHIRAAAQTAIGNAWKAGVAAEVIGLPAWSVGEQIYLAKVYLDTANLFAWTFALVCASWMTGRVLLKVLDLGFTRQTPIKGKRKKETGDGNDITALQVKGLCKTYEGKSLWGQHPLELTLEKGKTYALMAPSGSGKTTLFRILAGLESQDAGEISWKSEQDRTEDRGIPDVALAFEKVQFVGSLTLEDNLKLAGIGGKEAGQLSRELLSQKELEKPLGQYSLGMGRRAEVIRCMLSPATVLLLDEPFNGMDETTRKKTAEFIKKQQKGRLLVCITHKSEEAALLNAEILKKNWNFS